VSGSADFAAAATRLVAELMPISVAVAGDGAGAVAEALAAAGASAEVVADGAAYPADLAILLVPAGGTPADALAALVARLSGLSERLVLVPRGAAGPGAQPDMPAWFEALAEQGYQPVVEYDASYLGSGAFLVDRNAVAAESELAAFAERLALGGELADSARKLAALQAELAEGGERATLKSALDRAQAALAAAEARAGAWQARAEAAERDLAEAKADLSGWEQTWMNLRQWIGAVVADPGRDTLAALRALRPPARRRGIWPFRRNAAKPDREEAALLAQAAEMRAGPMIDPALYLAGHPELCARGGDPIWDRVLAQGSARDGFGDREGPAQA
jgi:hypothetical protein